MKKLSRCCLYFLLALLLTGLNACGFSDPVPETSGGTPDASLPGEGEEMGTSEEEEQGESMLMYLIINGQRQAVTLAENPAVTALIQKLREGDLTLLVNDYGGFEKVGSLGFSLPRSDERLVTRAGDVILYQGTQLVLFYGSNTWSYTRLGRIEGLSQRELQAFLGAGQGQVQVTLSLNGLQNAAQSNS